MPDTYERVLTAKQHQRLDAVARQDISATVHGWDEVRRGPVVRTTDGDLVVVTRSGLVRPAWSKS